MALQSAADIDEWFLWATRDGDIHPTVIDFVMDDPARLSAIDPRLYMHVSDILFVAGSRRDVPCWALVERIMPASLFSDFRSFYVR